MAYSDCHCVMCYTKFYKVTEYSPCPKCGYSDKYPPTQDKGVE